MPHAYEHDRAVEGYGLEAARELGVPPERVFKTLVTEADGALAVAIVPVSVDGRPQVAGRRARARSAR